MHRTIKALAGIVILGGAVFLVAGWVRTRSARADGPRTVEISTGSITEKAVATGAIEPRQRVKVKSKVSGNVKRCLVEIGDRVAPGDVLLEIVPDPTPAERLEAGRGVEAAQVAFDRADADFRRAEELHREGILPRGDLDARRESYERARIELAQAKDRRELLEHGRVSGAGQEFETVVRATVEGTVLERHVNPGDPVVPLTSYQEGTELLTLADMTDLVFKGTVDEIDAGRLSPGLPARLQVGALPDAKVEGTLARIAPQAREQNGARLFEIELRLDPGSTSALRAGYSANADLVIREKKDVPVLPERVVRFEDGGRKAWVEVPGEGDDAPPRRVEIETGLSDGLQVEVVSGLEVGQRVLEPAAPEPGT